jgi:hypothetical protein
MLRSSDRRAVTSGKGNVDGGGERIAERYEGRKRKDRPHHGGGLLRFTRDLSSSILVDCQLSGLCRVLCLVDKVVILALLDCGFCHEPTGFIPRCYRVSLPYRVACHLSLAVICPHAISLLYALSYHLARSAVGAGGVALPHRLADHFPRTIVGLCGVSLRHRPTHVCAGSRMICCRP